MTDTPLQYIIRSNRQLCENATEIFDAHEDLEALSYSILEEDEDKNLWRIDAYPVEDAECAALDEILSGLSGLIVTKEVLADADWLAMALSGLPPVRAGRFFVYGIHDRGKVPASSVNLRIEAGAAFGTGHHGTTSGCLWVFDQILKKSRPRRVLDVGAGTGVLAIAAEKTSARIALGTDIDPISVRISNENARLNQSKARFFYADGLKHPTIAKHAPYDLVFANILARPLVYLAPTILKACRPGGDIILSGLLRTQERMVRAAYRSHGSILVKSHHRDAWCTLWLKKPCK